METFKLIKMDNFLSQLFKESPEFLNEEVVQNVAQPRQLAALSKTQWAWVLSKSHTYNKDAKKKTGHKSGNSYHGMGHAAAEINSSTSAFYMMSVFLLFLTTLYMGVRLYFKRKFFTPSWENEYGPSCYNMETYEGSSSDEDEAVGSASNDSPVK